MYLQFDHFCNMRFALVYLALVANPEFGKAAICGSRSDERKIFYRKQVKKLKNSNSTWLDHRDIIYCSHAKAKIVEPKYDITRLRVTLSGPRIHIFGEPKTQMVFYLSSDFSEHLFECAKEYNELEENVTAWLDLDDEINPNQPISIEGSDIRRSFLNRKTTVICRSTEGLIGTYSVIGGSVPDFMNPDMTSQQDENRTIYAVCSGMLKKMKYVQNILRKARKTCSD